MKPKSVRTPPVGLALWAMPQTARPRGAALHRQLLLFLALAVSGYAATLPEPTHPVALAPPTFAAGDPENAGVFFGEVAGLIGDIPDAADILARTVDQAIGVMHSRQALISAQ